MVKISVPLHTSLLAFEIFPPCLKYCPSLAARKSDSIKWPPEDQDQTSEGSMNSLCAAISTSTLQSLEGPSTNDCNPKITGF